MPPYSDNFQTAPVVLENELGQMQRFNGPFVCAGRRQGCDLYLEDPQVSRDHFNLFWQDGTWMIQDTSANGTFLNGVRLTRNTAAPLTEGTKIGIRIRTGSSAGSAYYKNIEWTVHLSDRPPAENLYLGTIWFDLSLNGTSSAIDLNKLLEQQGFILSRDPLILEQRSNSWILRQSRENRPIQNGTNLTTDSGLHLYFGKNSEPEILSSLTRATTAFSLYHHDPASRHTRQELLACMNSMNLYIPVLPVPKKLNLPFGNGTFAVGSPFGHLPGMFPILFFPNGSQRPMTPLFFDPRTLRSMFPQAMIVVTTGVRYVDIHLGSQSDSRIGTLLVSTDGKGAELDRGFFTGDDPDPDPRHVLNADPPFPPGDEPTGSGWTPQRLASKVAELSNGQFEVLTTYPSTITKDKANLMGRRTGSVEFVRISIDFNPDRFSQSGHTGGGSLFDQFINLQHPCLQRPCFYNRDHECMVFIYPSLKLSLLRGEIDATGSYERAKALAITLQILNFLKYLYSQPVPMLLRQIDPDSFYITQDGRVICASLLSLNDILLPGEADPISGSPYTAPEVFTKKQDICSSVYSVGMMALYLVTGQNPGELISAYGSDIKVKKLGYDVSQPFDHFIRKSIRPASSARYQNLEECIDEIRAAAAPQNN